MREYDIQHWQNIKAYLNGTRRAFFRSSDRLAVIFDRVPKEVRFDLARLPDIKQAIEMELRRLALDVQGNVVNGINNEWVLANNKNDALVKGAIGARTLPAVLRDQWLTGNIGALEAFQKSFTGGKQLSPRVWDIVRGHAVDVERQMALSIYEGRSASSMATEMKQYLNNPDALFRRVRDNMGNLQLSKAAREYHPGQGVYRSAYKNALRMTRTETNKAYQQADNERWNKIDWVLGIEVRRSSSAPYDCDICNAGVGKYPKDYQWDLFHPNCLCYATPIMASDDEIARSLDAADAGQQYQFDGYVSDVPESFVQFQADHPNYTHFGH